VTHNVLLEKRAMCWVSCCPCLEAETTTQVSGAMKTVKWWNYTMTREAKEW